MTTVLEATDNQLQLQRTFAADLERVWAAWTDPNQVYRWFGCPDSKGLGANIDLRVGGAYEVNIHAHGREMTMQGVIAELEPRRKLTIDWKWSGNDEMAGLPTTRAEILFAKVADGTQITLAHSGFPNAEACLDHQRGWSASLERIELFTASPEPGLFAAIAEWDAALWNKDADRLIQGYTPETSLFDLGGQFEGPQAIKALWEQCFPYFGDQIGVMRKDVKFQVFGEAAMMTCLSRCTGMKPCDEGQEPDMMKSWFRCSVFYAKVDGQWKALHEHVSLPTDCMNEKPMYLLD